MGADSSWVWAAVGCGQQLGTSVRDSAGCWMQQLQKVVACLALLVKDKELFPELGEAHQHAAFQLGNPGT